jgi:hypothetical protein
MRTSPSASQTAATCIGSTSPAFRAASSARSKNCCDSTFAYFSSARRPATTE